MSGLAAIVNVYAAAFPTSDPMACLDHFDPLLFPG
jgi:hypothetical protein